MYAVVKTGGKQYRVAKDDLVTVERLEGEAGAKVKLDAVLAVGDESGIKAGSAVSGASADSALAHTLGAVKLSTLAVTSTSPEIC